MTVAHPAPSFSSRFRTAPGNGGPFLALAYLLFCAYAVSSGMSLLSVVTASLAVGIFQLFPGVLIWRLVRPQRGWLFEDLAFGFACGFALSVAIQCIAGLLGSRLLSVLLPLLVAAAILAVPRTRARVRSARREPVPAWLGAVIAVSTASAVPGVIGYFRQNQLSWSGYRVPHVDQYFQLAMSKQLQLRGPVNWPLLDNEGLYYHWFTHAWIAHVAQTSVASADEVLLRFAPIVAPFLVVLSVASLCLRLTGKALVAALGVTLTMMGGAASVWFGFASAPLNPESPTLAISVPALLAMVAVMAMRWRGEDIRLPLVLLGVFAFVAAGTKGSTTPLIIAGCALALVAMLLWRREMAKVVAIDLAVVVAALLISMIVVFHGSSNGLVLDPAAALKSSWPSSSTRSTGIGVLLIGAVTMLFTGLSCAAFGFVALHRDSKESGRRDPVLWTLLGATIAGAAAPMVFVQPGSSQFYFRLSAIPLAATASAIGLVALWEERDARLLRLLSLAAGFGLLAWWLPKQVVPVGKLSGVQMLTVLAIGGLLLAVVPLMAAVVRAGHTTVAATIAMAVLITGVASAVHSRTSALPQPGPVRQEADGAIGAGQFQAARYLGKHADPEAMVMTNRHCRQLRGKVCDSRYFMVSAISGRRMLVEGWGYSPTIAAKYPKGRESITAPFGDQALLRLNDGFIARPTADAAKALWDKGVRWIYIDKSRPFAQTLAPYAAPQFNNDQAQVWKLNSPRA